MKNFLYFLLMLFCIGTAFFFYSVMTTRVREKENYTRTKYVLIDTMFYNKLEARCLGLGYGSLRGVRLYDFTNNTHLAIGGRTINKLYEENSLLYFLHRNDSIYKKANNDSLFVYRGDDEYYFILGKDIN